MSINDIGRFEYWLILSTAILYFFSDNKIICDNQALYQL